MKPKSLLFFGIFLLIAACVDPFIPSVNTSNTGYLVVDGFINSGLGPTIIRLKRTIPLEETKSSPPELNAIVSVEGELGDRYSLIEKGNGEYRIDQLTIDHNKKYRIRVKTKNESEYVSDFVVAKQTPPIDSITYSLKREDNGLQVYVNTHDPLNDTWYYQWEFEETWQYHADYFTFVEYKNGQFIYNPYLNIYNCWRTEKSTSILTTSSTRLTSDVIYRFPLAFVGANSEKPQIHYSINVRQYALTKEAYEYLQELKKNTEQIGTIFDPQPSQLNGNVHCATDPDEPVIGYVSAHSVDEQRIFILNGGELPSWFFSFHPFCPEENGLFDFPPPSPALISIYYQTGYILPVGYSLDDFSYHVKTCVDCRTKGGTNIKPAFWPF